jgi:hypothetical protein
LVLNFFNDAIEYLGLQKNYFTGIIREWICELVSLDYLNLGQNEFQGPIPGCINALINLRVFLLYGVPEISGKLPIGICDLINLKVLYIEDTSIEGIIQPC